MSDVQLVRWPAESGRREHLRRLGVPRLLVIEGGATPPVTGDVQEDWVRAPVSREDVRVRLEALNVRSQAHQQPHVDPHGVLRFGGRSTPISPTATDLLLCLVRGYGVLVSREELQACLPDSVPCTNRNVLDLHIMRLRRRIKPVGLVIRTVWGRGYLLEPAAKPAGPVTGHQD